MAPARRAAGFAGKAAGEAQGAPVRGAVAGPGKERRVHEGLRQKHRKAVNRLHVRRQPPQAQPQNPRGQVAHPFGREDDETGIVGDQVQTTELLRGRPADPAVARSQLEGAGLPADQCEPGLTMHRDMAQALAEHAMERQVMVLLHQTVPAPVLPITPGRAHRNRTQVNQRIKGRQRLHDMHSAIAKTEWPEPKSGQTHRYANKRIALRRVGTGTVLVSLTAGCRFVANAAHFVHLKKYTAIYVLRTYMAVY